MTFWIVFLTGIVSLLLIWCAIRRKRKMELLSRNGIPGPHPNFWTGNLKEFTAEANVKFEGKMFRTYGTICGYYLGAKPFILVAEPSLIREILLGKSSVFNERPRRVPGGINPDPKRAHMLGNLGKVAWKRMREIVRRFFREKDLQKVSPKVQDLMEQCVSKIETLVSDEKLVEIDFYDLFKGLTLDVIAHTGFGIHSQIQNHGDDEFLKAVQGEFDKKTSSLLIKFYICVPEVAWISFPIRRVLQVLKEKLKLCPSLPLWKLGFSALHKRRALGNPDTERSDLLQHLILATPRLSDVEIVANSVLFLEAGYETTSSILAVLINLIARHKKVQDKLKCELIKNRYDFKNKDSHMITCTEGKLKYMDAVIFEALRLYPPQTTFIGRSPNVDFNYMAEDGAMFTIPKGCHVQIGLLEIQHNPLYWTEPQTFNPQRFMEGSSEFHNMKKFVWLPFGAGGRGCVGRRFAMNNLRLILANILARYDLIAYKRTESVIEMDYKIATMSPKNGSFVKVTKNPIKLCQK